MSQGEYISMGFYCLILLGNAATAWAVLSGKAQKRDLGPQPFDVRVKDRALTVKDHENLCGPLHQRVGVLESDVRGLRAKMESDKDEIIKSGEERVKSLHARIDGVPAQLIALLRDTKGLIQ